LPGGAVYIERWRLKNRNWETAVSLAGPLANAVLALLLGLILQLTPIAASSFGPGIAFLAFLQISAVVLNLIPLPPFDGFGALEPRLPMDIRMKLAQTQGMLSWVVLILLWQVPFIGNAFWGLVSLLAQLVGIPLQLAGLGMSQFMFW
jgi:Zn-dependent protease